MDENGKYTDTWCAVLDEYTCDECRSCHGKPIMSLNMIPPLHGPHNSRGRRHCRCTIKPDPERARDNAICVIYNTDDFMPMSNAIHCVVDAGITDRRGMFSILAIWDPNNLDASKIEMISRIKRL